MKKRFFAALLAVVMVLTAFPQFVFAQDSSFSTSLTVKATAQQDNTFLIPPQSEFSVESGLAKSFGYSYGADISEGQVTALDVLVKLHQELMGDDSAVNDALAVADNGFITTVFGTETSNFGFTVNGKQPCSDKWNAASGGYPGYYTAYTINECVVNKNDVLEFFVYQDTSALDLYTWFEINGKMQTSFKGDTDKEIEVTLKGYQIGWYGAGSQEDIARKTKSVSAAQLALVDESGSITKIEDTITDDNGKAKLKFTKAGEYTITAIGDEYEPIIMPTASVTVQEGDSDTSQPKQYEITDSMLKQTDSSANIDYSPDKIYDTFYYEVQNANKYTYSGKKVTFIDDKTIQLEGETSKRPLQSKKVSISAETDFKAKTAVITFDGLTVPVGNVSSKKSSWSTYWYNRISNDPDGGLYYIIYDTNIPDKSTVQSEQGYLDSLKLTGLPESGKVTLTNGRIFEYANKNFGTGKLDFGDGKGLVSEREFCVLPDIIIDMDDSENIGYAALSIEGRTIGKGDLLAQKNAAITAESTTVKDILDTAAARYGIDVKYTQVGGSYLISSINGLGSELGGGWKYQINDEFPQKSVNQFANLKDSDVIRIRYAATPQGSELENPLFYYLKALVKNADEKLSGNFTTASKLKLKAVIDEVNIFLKDERFNSSDSDKEIEVSKQIASLNEAVKKLETNQGSSEGDAQIPLDFENDVWLQYDFKQLKTNETAKIYPRRVPQIISDPINNDVARPNFNFEIVSGDSVKVTPVKDISTGRNNTASVTAVKNGITVVKITYDELEHKGKTYGASSSVNTAYVVYEVNDSPAQLEIKTDISLRSYDTVYFDKGESVDFAFAATADGAKSIKVTCNDEVLSKGQNGKYIAKLKNKSNIIGVTATDNIGRTKTFYQVIDARKIQINISNKTTPGEKLKINDTAIISFTGITPAVYKLATIYNPTWRSTSSAFGEPVYGTYVEYHNEHFGKLEGIAGQWDVATNNDFEITFDKEGTFIFGDGKISTDWWGSPLGDDKTIESSGPNLNAKVNRDKFSIMPEFSITIGDEISTNVPVKGITLDKTRVELYEGDTLRLNAAVTPENATDKTILWSTDGRYFATVDENGKITAHKASSANVPYVTITAKTKDGNFIASCKVVVKVDPNSVDEKKAQNVMDAIDKLFPVSLESRAAIAGARTAYNRLTAAQKRLVTNLDLLRDAESFYAELKREDDKLNEGYTDPEDKRAADAVTSKIAVLTNITIESADAVADAIRSYNALSSAQKRLVTNIALLFQAENSLMRLQRDIGSQEKDTQAIVNKNPAIQLEPNSPQAVNPTASLQIPKSASEKTIDVAVRIGAKLPLLSKSNSELSFVEQSSLIELAKEYTLLSEEERLFVSNSKELEAFIENIKLQNQQDNKTGIKVEGADWFVGLSIEATTNSPEGFKQVREMEKAAASGDRELLSVWDISLSNILDGKEYHPEEPVKISIPVDYLPEQDNVCVLHYKDDGTIEYIEPIFNGSAINFETSEFSYFALVSYADGASPFDLNNSMAVMPKSEESGETNAGIIWLVVLGTVALNCVVTVTIVFTLKRRRYKSKSNISSVK